MSNSNSSNAYLYDRFLQYYNPLNCSNPSCQRNMGVRHKELAIQFCNMTCFEECSDRSPDAMNVPTNGVNNAAQMLQQVAIAGAMQAVQVYASILPAFGLGGVGALGGGVGCLHGRGIDVIDANAKVKELKPSAPEGGNVKEIFNKEKDFPKFDGARTGSEPASLTLTEPIEKRKTLSAVRRVSGEDAKPEAPGPVKENPFMQKKTAVEDFVPASVQAAATAPKKAEPIPTPQVVVKPITRRVKNVYSHPGPLKIKKTGYLPIKEIEKETGILRCHANGLNDIYFQTQEMQNVLAEIMEDLTLFQKRKYGLTPLENFKVGDLCLAPYEDLLYRGEITEINENGTLVFFFDYGNEELIPKESVIFAGPDHFMRAPRMAVHGQWNLALSDECAEDELAKLMENEELPTKIIKKICDGQYLVQIGDHAPLNVDKYKIVAEKIGDSTKDAIYDAEFDDSD